MERCFKLYIKLISIAVRNVANVKNSFKMVKIYIINLCSIMILISSMKIPAMIDCKLCE